MYIKKQIGKIGENISCKYLKKNNYFIHKRNFRCKQGEIDIIEEFDFLEYKELKINKTNSRNKLKRKNNRQNNKQNVDDKYKKSKNKEKEIKTQSCNNTEKIFKKKVKTEYQEVYDLIFDGINSMDELYKKTGLKVKDINNMLFMLELEGNIIKTSGGYKCI